MFAFKVFLSLFLEVGSIIIVDMDWIAFCDVSWQHFMFYWFYIELRLLLLIAIHMENLIIGLTKLTFSIAFIFSAITKYSIYEKRGSYTHMFISYVLNSYCENYGSNPQTKYSWFMQRLYHFNYSLYYWKNDFFFILPFSSSFTVYCFSISISI